jgi:hypothetical protein
MEKQTIYEMFGFLLAFLGLGIAYMAVFLGVRNQRRERELEHEERMKAMEMGRSLPGDESPWSFARIGLIIASAVPIGVFVLAALASRFVGFQKDIWIAAGMVGIAAVICGSVVTCQNGAASSRSLLPEVNKEPVEDDVYDVVSARG